MLNTNGQRLSDCIFFNLLQQYFAELPVHSAWPCLPLFVYPVEIVPEFGGKKCHLLFPFISHGNADRKLRQPILSLMASFFCCPRMCS